MYNIMTVWRYDGMYELNSTAIAEYQHEKQVNSIFIALIIVNIIIANVVLSLLLLLLLLSLLSWSK